MRGTAVSMAQRVRAKLPRGDGPWRRQSCRKLPEAAGKAAGKAAGSKALPESEVVDCLPGHRIPEMGIATAVFGDHAR